MKAIIAVAGKSTRTEPLTLNIPKALLKVANKTILEHNLGQLEGLVDEVFLIVGFKKEMIQERFGRKYKNIKLNYIVQEEQLGTGHALFLAKNLVKGRFVFLMGDDLYHRNDIKRCIEHHYSILVQKTKEPERFGIVTEKSGRMIDLVEKPKGLKEGLANAALYVLDEKVFDMELEKSKRGEYEATDAVKILAKSNDVFCVEVKEYWLATGYAWNLIDANEVILGRMKKSEILGTIEKNVTIKGIVYLGKNSVIKNGAYIEGNVVVGENSVIGPNCFIRGSTSIGDNCKISNAVEIKNSVIMDHVNVCHLSYIWDSVIGENSNMGAGTITANLKHDNANVRSVVKGELVDTRRRKFGAIIADNVHTGIHTSIYPGRKIWPGMTTKPGEIVKEDIK